MNYLAHAYLSFNDRDLLTGNMISDFIKGKKQFDYPARILAGIKLHRGIDEFTDAHPVTQQIKELFRPAYRLYCGAMADVVYDFFLANDPAAFKTADDLLLFTEKTYLLLENNNNFFPEKICNHVPLYAYSELAISLQNR